MNIYDNRNTIVRSCGVELEYPIIINYYFTYDKPSVFAKVLLSSEMKDAMCV